VGRIQAFEKKELKNLFVFRKDKVAAGFGNLRNKELNGLYPSKNFTWFIKSRIIEQAGNLASTGFVVNIENGVVGKPKKVTSSDIQFHMEI